MASILPPEIAALFKREIVDEATCSYDLGKLFFLLRCRVETQHGGLASNHAVILYLFFVAKYRRKVFTPATLDDLRAIFASVCADFESELIEMQGEDDHVHLLVNFPPKASIAKLVNSLKGVSSRRLRRLHPGLRRRYRKASCGGAPISIIRQYIEQQRVPD